MKTLTRLTSLLLNVCVIAGFFVPVLAQEKTVAAASGFSVTGVVVNATTGAPVPRCTLTLRPDGNVRTPGRRFRNADTAPTAETDEHGRFTIDAASAGAWSLFATARGYVGELYQQHQQFASAVVLSLEHPTYELMFRLKPFATVGGVIVDEAGEPIRQASVQIMTANDPATRRSPERILPQANFRGFAQTDDRGMYEITSVPPGSYRLSVQAQPWYAASAQQRRSGPNNAAPSLDPPLDFVYPLTWFPGVDDPASAEALNLHSGDTREADFQLRPMASLRFRILLPPAEESNPNNARGGVRQQFYPQVTRIDANGGILFQPVSVSVDAQGQMDVSGLAPGTYQVRMQGPGGQQQPRMIRVAAGSVETLDLAGDTQPASEISLRMDGIPNVDPTLDPEFQAGTPQVNFIDMETGQVALTTNNDRGFRGDDMRRGNAPSATANTPKASATAALPQAAPPAASQQNRRGPLRDGQRGGQGDTQKERPAPRALRLAPGRYEVVLAGQPNLYLTGLSSKGTPPPAVEGRYVTLAPGHSTLTLHIAAGRAMLRGIASLEGKPCVGALALLVPAGLEDPASLTILRRDQTNTDGSYDFADVLPGQYILIVVDRGWEINWADSATLRHYLTGGIPLDLQPFANITQNIDAQLP